VLGRESEPFSQALVALPRRLIFAHVIAATTPIDRHFAQTEENRETNAPGRNGEINSIQFFLCPAFFEADRPVRALRSRLERTLRSAVGRTRHCAQANRNSKKEDKGAAHYNLSEVQGEPRSASKTPRRG